ncbi:MAG: phosphoribosylglycinamide formyltransferase [Candidatus Arsenophonus phytopathogenicus]
MKNFIVLISGNGSNLQAIIDACQKQSIAAKISAVFSDNPTAYGLERAKQAAIPTVVMQKTDYADNHAYDASLMTEIARYKPDLIVLAGYMRILKPRFVSHYLGKIINIHPSLLPKYPGLDTHRKALANGDKEHGTSIHFVTEKLDSGPIILQAKVPIFAGDQPQDIIARVQTQEHRIYPLVINWFVKGRLAMVNNSAFLDGCKLPEYGYTNED